MDTILAMIAENAVAATLLAVVVAAIGARWRNPGVMHVLWLLVLAKMLVPPVMELRLLPGAPVASPVADLASSRAPEAGRPSPDAPPLLSAPARPLPAFRPSRDLRATILPAIALGALIVLGTALVRVARFRHLVRDASPAPAHLAERAARIAAAMGIRRAPRIRLVPARIPPVLWPGPPCEILLPASLAAGMSDGELDALLAHELGHVQRRDHWTRGVELLATALFWWHPVMWWARRNLRAAEESCCDALVVRALGPQSRAYADALLKTIEFLTAAPHRPVPALATGAGDFHRLKERLTMIANRSAARPLSPLKRRATLAIALAALLVGPSWTVAETRNGEPPPAPPAPGAPDALPAPPASPDAPADLPFGHDEKLFVALADLQRRSAALQQQVLELERQRQLLEIRMEELQAESHALDLREEADRLQKGGDAERAALLREQADLLRELVASRRVEVESEHQQNLNRIQIESKLQALEMQRTAAELQAQLRELAPPDGD